MENKLQELTARLYGEGLEKGRAEADRLVEEAKAKAATILSEAKAEAEKIVKAAEVKAADIEKNSMTEIALAGREAIAKIKNELASAIIAKSTTEAIKGATVDASFVKELLLEVAKNWNGASEQLLAAGIEVGYSKEVKSGFKVGEKDGGYYIAFTDESFEALLDEYLREKVSQLLFA